jgi:hypothetical protein
MLRSERSFGDVADLQPRLQSTTHALRSNSKIEKGGSTRHATPSSSFLRTLLIGVGMLLCLHFAVYTIFQTLATSRRAAAAAASSSSSLQQQAANAGPSMVTSPETRRAATRAAARQAYKSNMWSGGGDGGGGGKKKEEAINADGDDANGEGEGEGDAAFDDGGTAQFPFEFAANGEDVVAVGDLHADVGNALRLLHRCGVVDARGHWSGGRRTLVQTGDLVDRGGDSGLLISLFMRLRSEATAAGGRVVQTLGNHELMNLQRDLRYVTPSDFTAYGGRGARALAYSPAGRHGRFLRRLPVVVTVGDTLFAHAGVEPTYAAWGVKEINRIAAAAAAADYDLKKLSDADGGGGDGGGGGGGGGGSGGDRQRARMVLFGSGGVLWTRLYGFAGDDVEAKRREQLQRRKERRWRREKRLRRQERAAQRSDGARSADAAAAAAANDAGIDGDDNNGGGGGGGKSDAHGDNDDAAVYDFEEKGGGDGKACAALATALKAVNMRRLVVGHTVQWGGRPVHLCGETLILNDVGISPAYGGFLAATIISADGILSTIHVPRYNDEENFD